MHLWTEYEGNMLAGFTLGRLSRSEGRSAFFLTSHAEGRPALLRLTEGHFDEGELTTRWQAAAKVIHPNLQAIYQSGQTTFEGTSLAWCLLEANDASLADILPERALTREEALQVAEAVAGALSALHAAGLVHEHVDGTNVFAMGETVKLRSDCIRECAGDFEADTPEAREELRKRDIHDLGILLRRCLTAPGQEPETTQLPSPFDRIVRRTLNGSVGAEGILAEVELLQPAPPPVPPQPSPANPDVRLKGGTSGEIRTSTPGEVHLSELSRIRPSAPGQAIPQQAVAAASRGRAPESPRSAVSQLRPAGSAPSVALADEEAADIIYAGLPRPGQSGRQEAAAATQPAPTVTRSYSATEAVLPEAIPASASARNTLEEGTPLSHRLHNVPHLHARSAADAPETLPGRLLQHKGWLAGGAVAALLGIVLWSTSDTSHKPAPATTPAAATTGTGVAGNQATAEPTVVAVEQPATAPYARSAQRVPVASGQQGGWRVIAYTYNYEKQAQIKAAQLQRRYASLHPQVFSPSGHAPYLVALGGPSDADTAMALRNRARHSGLPRDTFVRNF